MSTSVHAHPDLEGFLTKLGHLFCFAMYIVHPLSLLFILIGLADLDEAMGRAYNESISIPFGVGICGSVAETKETIYIRDAYKDSRFNSEVDAQTGYTTHSLVSMPVCNFDGEVIGVAQIMNKTGQDDYEFSDADLEVFRRYLTFCGIGLQNAQLFEVSILEYKKNKVSCIS